MSYNRRIRRDDFDIESIETFQDRGRYKSGSSGSRTRSRSRKRSYSRRFDNGSRSRSRSIEQKHRRGAHGSYSRSRSRSQARDYSRRSDRRSNVSKRYRESKSRSHSRSRSRSRSFSSRHQNERYQHKRDDCALKNKRRSRSRSRSRSSSHFRDFGSSSSTRMQSGEKLLTSISANVREENTDTNDAYDNLEDLPLPQQKSEGIYQFDEDEPIDRERIHREMEEKLRATLAKEGKVYPPPKAEASHPVFANDGSFLEIFKKMQQAQATTSTATVAASTSIIKATAPIVPPIVATANPNTVPYLAAAAIGKSAPPPPIVGRRRGGKILKTGVVAKPKIQTDANADPQDFWSLYLAEVNKYKNTACESEQGNRPLVK